MDKLRYRRLSTEEIELLSSVGGLSNPEIKLLHRRERGGWFESSHGAHNYRAALCCYGYVLVVQDSSGRIVPIGEGDFMEEKA